MVIVVAGIPRSGSTVQYNLVRIALELSGVNFSIHNNSFSPNGTQVELVKIHRYVDNIARAADKIFLTDRPGDQIIESFRKFRKQNSHPEVLKRLKRDLEKWKKHTKDEFVFQYSEWGDDRIEYTTRIINLLEVEVSPGEVLKEFDKIEIPEKRMDPVTFFYPNHITSNPN